MRGFAFRSVDDFLDEVIANKAMLLPGWVHCDWFWETDADGLVSVAYVEASCMMESERWYWRERVGRVVCADPVNLPRIKATIGQHVNAIGCKLSCAGIPVVRGFLGGTV